jgi:hypothetical protein
MTNGMRGCSLSEHSCHCFTRLLVEKIALELAVKVARINRP